MQRGSRLAHYEILDRLGSGGMGDVWAARDTSLGRTVAIKVLPTEMTESSERLARFEQEAKALAALDHPGIVTVHSIESAPLNPAGGASHTADPPAELRFITMQLVDGSTLDARIPRGGCSTEAFFDLSVPLADAVAAAHEQGIVHRDLKPANVLVTGEGRIKVLDFGLAKSAQVLGGTDTGTEMATEMTPLTEEGKVVGTVAYMSPEQARGKPVDRRTDLWALGCLLYEMLTGRRAFDGETATDVIACVLQREPEWGWLPSSTPPGLRRLLIRCLAKDADNRLRDAGDAGLLLREALAPDPVDDPGSQGMASRSPMARLVPWLVAAAAVLAAVAAWTLRPSASALSGPARFSVTVPQGSGVPVLYYGGSSSLAGVALAPDGSRIAYVGHDGTEGSLRVQRIGDFDAAQLPGTLGAIAPFFSPSGAQLGFFAGGQLLRIALPGGVPVAITPASRFAEGATWTADDRIVFTPSYADPLSIVPSSGGVSRVLTRLDAAAGEASHRWPHALPENRGVLFVVKTTTMEALDEGRIAVADLDTREHRVVLDGGTRPSYLDSGHLVLARTGRLYAAPFDLGSLEVTGAPVPVLEGVMTSPPTGNALYAVTAAGALAYIAGGSMVPEARIVRLTPGELPEYLPLEVRNYTVQDLAPDGRRLLVGLAAANDKLWVADLRANSLTRLATGAGNDQSGCFSPDGRWVIFASDRQGGLMRTHRMPVDGSASPEPLFEDDAWGSPGQVARRVRLLGYEGWSDSSGFDAYLLPLTPEGALDGQPRLVAGGVGDQIEVAPSPDGSLVAYTSTESGDTAVYVVVLESGDRVRLTGSTSSLAVWGAEGDTLFYSADRKVYRVELLGTAPLTFGEPELLASDLDYDTYTLDSDGRSLLASGIEERLVRRREIRLDLAWGERVATEPASDR